MRRKALQTVGLTFWLLTAASLAVTLWHRSGEQAGEQGGRELSNELRRGAGQMLSLGTRPPPTQWLWARPTQLPMAGDPVFVRRANLNGPPTRDIPKTPQPAVRLVGWVVRVEAAGSQRAGESPPAGTVAIQIAWRGAQPPGLETARWRLHRASNSLGWLAAELLPPHELEALRTSLIDRFARQQPMLQQELEEVFVSAVRQLAPHFQQQLQKALRDQEAQLEALAAEYQQRIWQGRFLPALQTELWPSLQHHLTPVATVIGRQLWERVSLWRFTWRMLYDQTPLPKRQLVETEFERFMEQEGVPVLAANTEQLLEALGEVVIDLRESPKLRAVLRETLRDLLDDPQLRQLLISTLQRVSQDDGSLRELIDQELSSRAAQRLRWRLERVLDPWLREAGAKLLGDPQGGLTPQFAALLRSQVLLKDRSWIVIEPSEEWGSERSSAAALPIWLEPAEQPERYPLILATGDRS
jgi:hypothetical protein